MTPDRMVVDEARRTFTYLNLYGYLTDAVVVNRALPRGGRADTSAPGASASWRRSTRSGRPSRRSPCCARRTSARRSSGPRCSTTSATRVFEERDPGAVLHQAITQELVVGAGAAELRMDLPFAQKGDDLAEEDRPRARGPRRRPQAHAHAPARAGRLPAHRRLVRRRRPARDLRWPRLTRCPSCASASTPRRPPPSAWRARRASTPAPSPIATRATSSTRWSRSCARCASWSRRSCRPRSARCIRQVLLLLRAVIDYWVDRLDAPRPAEVEVQDIPIS